MFAYVKMTTLFSTHNNNQCKKLLSLKHSVTATCHASKTTKITVFDPVICRTPHVHLLDELLYRTFVVYADKW